MAKSDIRLINAKEYKDMKAMVNKYERTWRKKNPEKHKAESKALIQAIVKARTKPVKKAKKASKPVEPKAENTGVAK